jgi:hypothetical protein
MKQYKEQYYNGVERMNPYLENKIKENTTDVSKNPAFPSVDKDGNPTNFIELLAYKRFLDVVKRVKHFTGMENISGEMAFNQLQRKFAQSLFKVFEIEKQHRAVLEKLGVDLVIEEMELPEGAIKINAKIVDMGAIERDGFQTESKEPKKDEVESQFKEEAEESDMTPMQVFELEKEKRRFINLLIQGASKKGHYMYELRRTEINRIHPELADLYGIVMSINDLTYWLMPENVIEQISKDTNGVAGKEEIEENEGNEEETSIKTQAICFPVSVHENIKGVMEVFGTHGLPDDKEAQEMIINSTDTLMNEVWDIRLGVVVWEKFLNAYPIEVFEQGQKYIQHFIFSRFCALNSDEFFEVSKQILSDNPKGIKFIQDMVNDIVRDMQKSDLDDTFGSYDYDDEDEFKRGGNVPSIEKRIAVVNNLIALGNANDLTVVDSTITWEAPMKYNPLKYTNGVLYVSYQELDLYNYLKRGGTKWKKESYKVGKNEMGESVFKGSAQTDTLTKIANMYRKALRNAGIQFADGGMAGLSEVSPMLPNPLPMSVIQPMANGGEIKSLEKSLENAEKNYRKAVQSERVGIISPTELNRAKNKVDSLRAKVNDWYASRPIKKRMADGGDLKDFSDNQLMIMNQNVELEHHHEELEDILEDKTPVPAWAVAKMATATESISDVTHYLDGQTKMADGGTVEEQVSYLDRRIKNLESMVIVMNEDERENMYNTINGLKSQREKLLRKESTEVEAPKKRFFGLFKKGGETQQDEYDVYDNKRMLKNQAVEIEHHSEELNSQVKMTKKVPAWVIAKMERATTDLSDITHYLDGENKMADGGDVNGKKYEIVPHSEKFIAIEISSNGKNAVRNFDGSLMEFNDIKSAQNFVDNIVPKYPYGMPKASAGMLLLASQFLPQQQQQQQPQVVYYVPQPQMVNETGIEQNIPQMASGGETSNKDLNDFCITQIIGLANDLQKVWYYTTERFDNKDVKSEYFKGRLIIVFKEPVKVALVNAINEFIERAEDCHDIFDKSVNVTGNNPNSITVNLLTDKFTDKEYKKGGRVYEYSPKKINLSKTKKITTELGDYNLALITNDFVYFVNSNESDENAQTIMYNKKGELLSDNYHATNDLYETLESQDKFEFIHPDIEAYRQEIISGN